MLQKLFVDCSTIYLKKKYINWDGVASGLLFGPHNNLIKSHHIKNRYYLILILDMKKLL